MSVKAVGGPERPGPERPGPDYPPEWDAEPTWEVCARCEGRGGDAWEGPCTDCLGEGRLPDYRRITHDAEPAEVVCDGLCVMGNEVMPGEPTHQGHNDDPRGGYYDWAAYPHPDCPRHGTSAATS